jgi:site-specific recombinase XerD
MIGAKVNAGNAAARLRQAGGLLSDEKALRDPGEQAVFIGGRYGTRLQVPGIRERALAHGKAVGIRRLHPHALRHAFATHLLDGGADVRHVQELLGHASADTTAVYTRVALAQLRRAIGSRHPRGRLRVKAQGG